MDTCAFSTVEQNEDRQRIDLIKWGIEEKNIYLDKVSGKDFNRQEYQKLRRKLKDGDLLVVKSLDRLGRNYEDIQSEWRYLVREKKVDIVIMDMPLLDTRTNKDLIGTPYLRHRFTASILCSAGGARKHQAASGGRNSGRACQRRTSGAALRSHP